MFTAGFDCANSLVNYFNRSFAVVNGALIGEEFFVVVENRRCFRFLFC
jgi:hypothetical protein